jgi:hypothetical protein
LSLLLQGLLYAKEEEEKESMANAVPDVSQTALQRQDSLNRWVQEKGGNGGGGRMAFVDKRGELDNIRLTDEDVLLLVEVKKLLTLLKNEVGTAEGLRSFLGSTMALRVLVDAFEKVRPANTLSSPH